MKMLQQALSFSFLISSLMFLNFSVSTANPNIYVQCSQFTFTPTTPYESNVNSIFTSLLDSASLYNFNKFETSPSQNNNVCGLFQCRGDINIVDCKDCVTNAISQLKTTCPISMGGQIQLEHCFVKYDNTSFFGAQEKAEMCKRCGPSIGYNSDVLNRIDNALAYLVGGNGQYFRRGESGSIQGVAQCVQDLSLSDCQDCLLEARGRLRTECLTSTWGDMYLGKCYIRYADQASNENDGVKSNSKNNILKWIIVAVVAIIIALAAVGLIYYIKNCYKIKSKACKALRNTRKIAESAKSEAESAKSEAKSATEMAAKYKEECQKKNHDTLVLLPYPPPMPPPCLIFVPDSNPNTCALM